MYSWLILCRAVCKDKLATAGKEHNTTKYQWTKQVSNVTVDCKYLCIYVCVRGDPKEQGTQQTILGKPFKGRGACEITN